MILPIFLLLVSAITLYEGHVVAGLVMLGLAVFFSGSIIERTTRR